MKPDTSKQWYYTLHGEQQGPVQYDKLKSLAQAGILVPMMSKVWCQGLPDWIGVQEVEGLFDVAIIPPVLSTSREVSSQHYKSPQIKPVNFQVFIAVTIGGGILTVIGAVLFISAALGAQLSGFQDDIEWGSFLSGGILVLLGMSLAVTVVLQYVYRMWLLLPKKYARTTPRRAVWLLFIPLYSYYWFFVAFKGWAEDYTQFKTFENISNAPKINEKNFKVFAVLNAVSALSNIPLIGLLFSLVGLVNIYFFYVNFLEISQVINFFANSKKVTHSSTNSFYK